MGVATQRFNTQQIANEIDGKVEFLQRFTAVEVLHPLDIVEGKVQVLELLQPAYILFASQNTQHI